MFTNGYLSNITIFAGNFAPVGWALCNGALLDISSNDALYALIGTTYGGDGISTFALPDFRGRVAIHQGQGTGLANYIIGQQGGNESIVLTTNQLAQHTHAQVSATGSQAASTSSSNNVATPVNNVPAVVPNVNLYDSTGGIALVATVINAQTASAGLSQPVETLSPYLAMNYIICVTGIFPSRN